METQNNNINVETVGTSVSTLENKNYQLMMPLIKNLSIIVIGIIVGVALGLLIDPYLPSYLNNVKKAQETGYEEGFSTARKLVEKSALGNFFKTQSDVRSISGTVTAIQGNRISIHSSSMSNPFDGPAVNDRTIIIDANTIVIQLATKDSATIEAEFDASIKAQKTSKATSTLATSREAYIQKIIDASGIQVGDSLIVIAGENVKTIAEFTAQEIQIRPKMITK